MRYRTLGKTGVSVSTLCLGTMMFGSWGNTDEGECRQMVDMALEAGVNFVDTADVYGFGDSEQIVGRALKGRRDDVVLATKLHNPMGPDRNERGNSRRWIVRAAEESLRRLDTDRIDLYQVHRPDPDCEIDETLSALSDLVHQGKVLAIGTSTFPAEDIVEAQWVAKRRNRERFVTEQPPYSVFTRGVEAAVLPTCERFEIGALVYSPLNGGWLTGKYRRGEPPPESSRASRHSEHFDYGGPVHERKLDAVEGLDAIAKEAGLPLIHLALAFVLEHPAVVSAILGPRVPGQLAEQLTGGEVRLDDDLLDRIDAVVPPGTNLNPTDAGWVPPALAVAWRRRGRYDTPPA